MKEKILKLVNTFVDSAKKYHQATMYGNSRSANAQVKRMNKAFMEITLLGDNAREALLRQIDNKDNAVALMVATYSLKYSPKKALSTLERLAKNDTGIIGFGAEQAIQRWNEGEWHLE